MAKKKKKPVPLRIKTMAERVEAIIEGGGRGSGRTTRQIKEAPRGAIYIVRRATEIPYTRRLAHDLGRDDLKIVDAYWLTDGRWYGLQFPAIIRDHAADLTQEQWDILGLVVARIRKPHD